MRETEAFLTDGVVVDRAGEKIGKLEFVYLADKSGRPEWVTVSTSFDTSRYLVPLEQAEVQGNRVRVAYSKDKVRRSPRRDTEEQRISHKQAQDLYRYYGIDESGQNEAGATDSEVAEIDLGALVGPTPVIDRAARGDLGDAPDQNVQEGQSGPSTDDVKRVSRKWFETQQEVRRAEDVPSHEREVTPRLDGPPLSEFVQWANQRSGGPFKPSELAVALEEMTSTLLRGPRTPDLVDRVLSDDWLSSMLKQSLLRNSPDESLRGQLMSDPQSSRLLALAPEPPPVDDPEKSVLRFQHGAFVPVEVPQAHAAAGETGESLFFRTQDDDLGVVIEGYGPVADFHLRVTGVAAPSDRFVALWVKETRNPQYVLPLLADNPVASLACPPPEVVAAGEGDSGMEKLSEGSGRALVVRSVRASLGGTEEAWRVLAQRVGPGTPLYAAVAEGLR